MFCQLHAVVEEVLVSVVVVLVVVEVLVLVEVAVELKVEVILVVKLVQFILREVFTFKMFFFNPKYLNHVYYFNLIIKLKNLLFKTAKDFISKVVLVFFNTSPVVQFHSMIVLSFDPLNKTSSLSLSKSSE
jgi:hypothetical protein